MKNLKIILYLLGLIYSQTYCYSQEDRNEYLLKSIKGEYDEIGCESGYKNQKGEMVIQYGKYYYCQTDTFRTIAIVYTKEDKIIAINRNEKELFEIFVFDNGPDPIQDGLFRIIKNGKIGYANSDGKIVITPKYECAYPFENGIAKVSLNCSTTKNGEHTIWYSSKWIYINKKGKIEKTIRIDWFR